MNRTKIITGCVLAGVVAPALGITANAVHSWGMNVAAVCISLTGVGLMLHEILSRRTRATPNQLPHLTDDAGDGA